MTTAKCVTRNGREHAASSLTRSSPSLCLSQSVSLRSLVLAPLSRNSRRWRLSDRLATDLGHLCEGVSVSPAARVCACAHHAQPVCPTPAYRPIHPSTHPHTQTLNVKPAVRRRSTSVMPSAAAGVRQPPCGQPDACDGRGGGAGSCNNSLCVAAVPCPGCSHVRTGPHQHRRAP
jgi:hypothetical protein